MDKQTLITSAAHIGPFSDRAVREYEAKADRLVSAINEAMLNRADSKALIGAANTQMMKDNHANHARFILSIMKHYDPEVLVETILWVFRAYRSHGFSSMYWAAQINTWMSALNEYLEKDSCEQVMPLYTWIQVNIPLFEKLSEQTTGRMSKVESRKSNVEGRKSD